MSYLLLQTHPVPRHSCLLSVDEYREAESNKATLALSSSGALLEYETLELRLHPPNVEIDNTTFNNCTIITVDSANRPGTLVEVVQCLTELGLNVKLARISSDGGWFVDEFHVTECDNTKVVNEKKLNAIRKVLGVDFETGQGVEGCLDPKRLCRTVLELAGLDRPGVLADAVHLLTHNGCDVESVAVWTYGDRCAFVICVVGNEHQIKDPMKIKRLSELLQDIMDPQGSGIVRADHQVKGPVHYERRLHQLMLAESERIWQETNGGCSTCLPEFSTLNDSHLYISHKYSKPDVTISWDSHRGYWLVEIKCKDRNKLLFDTVCTLADLRYDIYHGTVDTEADVASQLFYIRPRFGDAAWDAEKARKLKFLLEASIQRRFPKGIKVHVKAQDTCCLATMTQAWKGLGLSVTRVKVRALSETPDHTFYLMDASGAPPDQSKVQEACQRSGGRFLATRLDAAPSKPVEPPAGADPQFTFCFLHRNWSGSPSSCTSSSGSSQC